MDEHIVTRTAHAESTNLQPHALLWITEILVLILSKCDIRHILAVCQRVCRRWRDIITESPILQEHLFFRQRSGKFWNEVEINPSLRKFFWKLKANVKEQRVILERRYAPDGTAIDEDEEASDDDVQDEDEAMGPTTVNGVSTLAQWHVIDLKYRFLMLNKPEGLSKTDLDHIRDAFFRKEASWRRMLLCQPVLEKPKESVRINKNPNFKYVADELVAVCTKWTGSDVGPWPEAAFTDMVPFLRAEFVARHGRTFLSPLNPTPPVTLDSMVFMRLSWGPVATHGETDDIANNFMMAVPSGKAVHMAPFDNKWQGRKLTTRYPFSPDVSSPYGPGNSGSHNILDLVGENAYTLHYERHGTLPSSAQVYDLRRSMTLAERETQRMIELNNHSQRNGVPVNHRAAASDLGAYDFIWIQKNSPPATELDAKNSA